MKWLAERFGNKIARLFFNRRGAEARRGLAEFWHISLRSLCVLCASAVKRQFSFQSISKRFVVFAACLSALTLTGSCGMFSTDVASFVAEPFPKQLSEWRLFVSGSKPLTPNKGVVPYDLNTPLFSDYADKYRFVWMPAGTSAKYSEDGVFEFPVGTVLAKTFAFPATDGSGKERIIETRLLVHGKNGWVGLPYVWNAEQTDARLELVASPTEVTRKAEDGSLQKINYIIPNANECKQCHDNNKLTLPIGPKARNLNKEFPYADGVANQLAYWTKVGYLKGAPAADTAPKVPAWSNVASGSLEARARAYLDNNCAHCHQPGGSAEASGVNFSFTHADLRKLGACKMPNSAGYSGGHQYDLVPGNPAESILLFRMESTKAKEMMPEIGRSLSHKEGVALVREWLATLKGGCGEVK
jgi:uncharacterized repeat protein (TIGR03806 family)